VSGIDSVSRIDRAAVKDVLTPTRPGGHGDALDGVVPAEVCSPGDGAALAAVLASAASRQVPTVIRGGGTKLGWGRVPEDVGLVVSTAALDAPLVHRDGDLTVTVGAGARLVALNQQLARKGQWLPVDSAFERATIGGIVATNDAGPLRHRYGTPRDLLIGITLALADGRVVKSGGTVVKNVAGYDLGRLISGSHGTLAAIVDATFKLLPVPRASTTLVVRYASADRLAADVSALASSQLEPLACDVHATGPDAVTLLLRFASSPVATDAQAGSARALVTGDVRVCTGDAEAACWTDQVRAPWVDVAGDGSGVDAPGVDAVGAPAVIRASWLPSKLRDVLGLVSDLTRLCAGVRLAGRAMVGTGLMTIAGTAAQQVAAVERVRGQVDTVGHVVLLRARRAVKDAVDVWGGLGGSEASLRALKRSLDPANILNAGRGPI
jgi:glycolate oxidase FAD binding subunit